MSVDLHPEAARLIEVLDLAPHPEGGWYRETWRGAGQVVATEAGVIAKAAGDQPRSTGTAIYYLLAGDEVSHLHRLRHDEVWHFYAGSGLDLHLFPAAGDYRRVALGPTATPERGFQTTVPAGCVFGATVDPADGFALVGCTMAPGFAVEDFELLARERLLSDHPGHHDLICRLTFDTP